jgi:hypothetical protein
MAMSIAFTFRQLRKICCSDSGRNVPAALTPTSGFTIWAIARSASS